MSSPNANYKNKSEITCGSVILSRNKLMSDKKSATTRLIKSSAKNRIFQEYSDGKKPDFVRVLSKSKERMQN